MIKEIKGTGGKYTVSDDGYVYGPTGIELSQQVYSGYCTINIKINGEVKSCKVHRLVAQEFCEKGVDQYQVHHIDSNPYNNKSSNLIWCNDIEHGKLTSKNPYEAIKATNVISGQVNYFPSFACLKFYGIKESAVRRRVITGTTYQQCRWELCYGPIIT